MANKDDVNSLFSKTDKKDNKENNKPDDKENKPDDSEGKKYTILGVFDVVVKDNGIDGLKLKDGKIKGGIKALKTFAIGAATLATLVLSFTHGIGTGLLSAIPLYYAGKKAYATGKEVQENFKSGKK